MRVLALLSPRAGPEPLKVQRSARAPSERESHGRASRRSCCRGGRTLKSECLLPDPIQHPSRAERPNHQNATNLRYRGQALVEQDALHATGWNTYWYLEATPTLLADIASACERFIQGGAL